jgi:hypothetical protein
MVFNTTFNNISVISWLSVLLVKETGVPGENHSTFVISAYHHWCCEFESRSGEVYSIQHYVIKFVSDLRQGSGFLQVLRFPSPIKLTATIITKVVVNPTTIWSWQPLWEKEVHTGADILFTVYFSLLIQEILNYRTLNINLYIESKLQMPMKNLWNTIILDSILSNISEFQVPFHIDINF